MILVNVIVREKDRSVKIKSLGKRGCKIKNIELLMIQTLFEYIEGSELWKLISDYLNYIL